MSSQTWTYIEGPWTGWDDVISRDARAMSEVYKAAIDQAEFNWTKEYNCSKVLQI